MPRNSDSSVLVRRLLFLSCAALLGLAHPAAAQEPVLDQSIASGYLRQAERLYESGDHARALTLLERSLEFYPGYSESLYLKALIHMRRQDTLEAARDALEQALDSGLWLSTPPRQAQTELSRLYVWTRRYGAAEGLLQALAPDRGLGGTGSADLAELWARALIGAGRLGEAEALLERALRRYPDTPALYVLAADLLDGRRRPREAAELLDRGLGELPRSAPLLYARARVEPVRERRVRYLERYLEAEGTDPGAAALLLVDLLELGPPGEPAEAALESFLDLDGALYVPMVDRLRGALLARGAEEPYRGLLERLNAELKGYTGGRIVDADRDGWHEERYEYENGSLRIWSIDRDQNGVPEVRAEYQGEEAARLAFTTAGGTVVGDRAADDVAADDRAEYVYSRYPYLKQLVYVGGGSRRVYELVPFRYTFDALSRVESGQGRAKDSSQPPDHPLGRRLRLNSVVPEAEARRRASRMAEYPIAGSPSPVAERVHILLSGQTVRIDQAPDGEGRYRHQVFYDGGRPTSGLRDLDGDGVFETREQYSGGELTAVLLDQDGDGNAELTELFRPNPSTRSEQRWDYDSDGRVDSRQRLLADGSTVREFSSRLDGSFDLRAVFRGGGLQEFRRDNRLLAVRYDPSRDLYRIGDIRGWDRLPDPLTEGIHRSGGSRLFVFEHQGKIYIGELQ